MMRIKAIISILSLGLACFLPTSLSAEVIPGTDLSIDFHAGHVVGAGRNINMIRVPVTDINTGQTTLWDATFKFSFIPSQGFVFEEISSASPSQPGSIADIVPGLYRTQQGKCLLLEGPTLLNGSRSLYTIRGVQEAGCGTPDSFSAQIISGVANGHPDIGERDIVASLTDNWIYGFMADRASNSSGSKLQPFFQNHLIGIRQSGEQLILGRFSDGGADLKDPVQTLILTRLAQ
ncbi:hypothetical protein [Nitrosomonas aestuarii]|uniref:hypothetical protein n=1 Tax=Nitrosomonas aestuarii TaxID=52441 RepID=UPI000D30E6AB|nr:hypothetical protein [Nitrosomonas aestuarii]PTN08441.1 hypothetical protein C8R11_12820 [Nitrosomonas aestuarii]